MTATKERPIILTPDEVLTVLDTGRVELQRPVTPPPKHRLIEGLAYVTVGMDPADEGAVWYDGDGIAPGREVRCPYGVPGDRLWVREAWHGWLAGDFPCIAYKAGGGDPNGANPPRPDYDVDHPCWSDRSWRLPFQMPRWASRLTLAVTAVHVEWPKSGRWEWVVGAERVGDET
jgi:hypothetical protein